MSRRAENQGRKRLAYEVLGGALLILCLVAVGSKFFGQGNRDFHMNLFTEAAGIVVTIFLVNRWYAMRESDRKLSELESRLVREAGSQVNQTALNAIEELRDSNWITGEDGLLSGASLRGANLANAQLSDANLNGAKIDGAILTGARLVDAELQNASLERAILHKSWMHDANLTSARMDYIKAIQCAFDRSNLQHVSAIFSDMRESGFSCADLRCAVLAGTDFRGANLHSARLQDANLSNSVLVGISWLFTEAQNAKLRMANFQQAEIRSSDLEGADLSESDFRKARVWGSWLVNVTLSDANLEEADLRASFLENAILTGANLNGVILPDGTRFSETTDMNRFTDRNHPEYAPTIEATNEQREQLRLDD